MMTQRRRLPIAPNRRHGMVLVVVLVVITLLSLGALTFSELMMAEREGAEVAVAQSQARASAESGVEMAKLFVAQDADTQLQDGGWYDNGARFRGAAVTPEAGIRGSGRFTLVAPKLDQDGLLAGIRFGLEDESARLNLNTVAAIESKTENQGKGIGRRMLMALPGMTEDVADAILDWMDLDDEPREYGAEIDAYAGLNPGYATKNGPPDTLEELLLVRGVTPQALFGLDTNRNYLLDKAESNGAIVADTDSSDGSGNFGWAAYLTLFGKESGKRSDGQAKIDLNQSDLNQLYQDLESAVGKDWATFIVAFRQSNGYTNVNPGSNQQTISPSSYELDLTKKAGNAKITTVLDLITPQGKGLVVGSGRDQKTLESPFPDAPMLSATFLPKLLDNCTVASSGTTTPRVNINLASRVVLTAVLSADEELGNDSAALEEMVSQIIAERPQPDDTSQTDESFKYETWLYSKLILKLDQMKRLMPYLCASGSVYRAQSIGYFDRGGPAARIEVVIDATSSPPSIVFWRDMTYLGRGYPLETLGIQASDSSGETSAP